MEGGRTLQIREMLGLHNLLSCRKILCIQPHPDDNEIGAAGTILEWGKRGAEIAYVTVTDGRAGAFGSDVDPVEMVQQRHEEKQLAGNMIGITQHYDLGFPDSGCYREEDVTKQLVGLFREYRPELVLTVDPWSPYEAHPDHLKTGRAVAKALLFCNNVIVYPRSSELPSAAPVDVPQVAFYATSYPNTFVDITSNWQRKLDAIMAHKSQFDNADWPQLSAYFEYSAQEFYRQLKHDETADGFAEAFKVLSTRQLHFFPTAIFN